jgi:FkbM family methyltransferase
VVSLLRRGGRYLKRKLRAFALGTGVQCVPSDASITYSQAGEDRVLAFLLGALGIHRPSYIDIGAHHPRRGNSTYLLYSQGSRGVCVEPNPEFAATLKGERPNDVTVEAGIVPRSGLNLQYYMFAESTFNTFSEAEANIRINAGGEGGRLLKVATVRTLTLDELLSEYAPLGVDVLAIDIEGMDEVVVSESNLIVRPKIIMVETVPFSGRHPVRKTMGIVEILVAKRYRLVADTYINTIFIDESLLSEISPVSVTHSSGRAV